MIGEPVGEVSDMAIWLVRRCEGDEAGHDETSAMVVRAPDMLRAITLCAEEAGYEGSDAWMNAQVTKLAEKAIGLGDNSGVILKSNHGG